MSLEVIANFIKARIGIIADSIGMSSIERAIKARMSECGERDINSYFDRVKTSKEELQQLVNDITVPETWFFRDRMPFNLLAEYVSQVWIPDSPNTRLKILSVPCSTGEEPYSIAITLFEAGLTASEFHIDAVDVNTRVLEMARRGCYGQNSFRGKMDPDSSPFFRRNNNAFEVVDLVKETVSFQHGNILDTALLAGNGLYNVVFCRNLLIYFDMDTKNAAIRNLHRLIANDGLLFLGHAETGRIAQGQFVPIKHPGAFAYQKAGDDSKTSAYVNKKAEAIHVKRGANEIEPISGSVYPAFDFKELKQESSIADVDGQESLQTIQMLADSGELDKAVAECQKYIRKNQDNPEGYYLMGIIALAKDKDREAEEWLRKTIYLDPKHYHALIQLAIIYDEQGNITSARNFRARAERVKAS